MYYRVATQVNGAPAWKWKSTALSELSTVFQFLRLFRSFPQDQLRVFSSSSREGLAELLEQENKGLASTSVTAAQFLEEHLIQPSAERNTSAREGGTSLERGSIAVMSQPAAHEHSGQWSASMYRGYLERRREELESGPGGDHDQPYCFSLPLALPQVRAWMALLSRVRMDELHP